MGLSLILAVKIFAATVVFLLHHPRLLKATVLAVLVFLAIPMGSPDDIAAWALIGGKFGIVGVIAYYIILWLAIFLIWKFM